uniref:FAD-binding protein n=1 Tax=Microbacterium sp. TaxID=51671 RepID=UPI0026027E93
MIDSDTLAPDFTGDIIRPGDEDYPAAARTALAQGSPSIVLRPRDAAEVRRALRWAAQARLEIAVRGGGH